MEKKKQPKMNPEEPCWDIIWVNSINWHSHSLPSIHFHPQRDQRDQVKRGVGQVERLLSLGSAMCVAFTSKVGAKGNSGGQLVCNTLHGVVGQPRQRVQFLPGVRGRGDAIFRAAEQHDITTNVQRALDLTCWHGRGHWQVESEQ